MVSRRAGFTLIELTIVLGLLAILAAILVPLFLRTTDRARLRSDIQSARVIQNAMDLYRVERGVPPAGAAISNILQTLVSAGYINPRNTETQTVDAEWVVCATDEIVKVCLDNVTDAGVHAAVANLSEAEQDMVLNWIEP